MNFKKNQNIQHLVILDYLVYKYPIDIYYFVSLWNYEIKNKIHIMLRLVSIYIIRFSFKISRRFC